MKPNGFSGISGICFSSQGAVLGFFSENIFVELPELIKAGDKETAILELEIVAKSVAAHLWKTLIASVSHRAVLFADQEAVRSSILKGSSANHLVDCFMRDFFKLGEKVGRKVWLKRVPSQSNLVDEPSRKICDELLGSIDRKRVDVMKVGVSAAQSTRGDSAA